MSERAENQTPTILIYEYITSSKSLPDLFRRDGKSCPIASAQLSASAVGPCHEAPITFVLAHDDALLTTWQLKTHGTPVA
jgi:hypothetical protein